MLTLENVWGEKCLAWWDDRIPKEKRLLVKIIPNAKIHQDLGAVKVKNDGRYEWTVRISHTNFFGSPKVDVYKLQGVCSTESEAQNKVQEIWQCSISSEKISPLA